MKSVPVIDLFAGPGGLGEGFSSVMDDTGRPVFDIKLSIEKDESAHKTLTWRSFYRQFIKSGKDIPDEYYEIMRERSLKKREERKEKLFKQYTIEYAHAQREAWQCTLGGENFPPELVNERITKALNGAKDWVLIGGPPCQAYSIAGRSRRQEGEGLNPQDHRVHLYKEYLRIIATHHPTAFVMENVKGLLSARVEKVKIFDLIKRDLANPNIVFPKSNSPQYKIYSLVVHPEFEKESGDLKQPIYKKDSDYLIKAENYGVPQKRHRVILLGIRSDIEIQPQILTPKKRINLEEVIGDLPKLRSGINRSFLYSEQVPMVDGGTKIKRIYKKEKDSEKGWLRLMKKFKSEIVGINSFAKDFEQEDIELFTNGTGHEFVPCSTPAPENPLYDWLADEKIKGAANHQSRSHLVQDLKRYLFASIYTKKYGKFPRLVDYSLYGKELLPDHENAESGKFADRFRVQLPNEPATTVTSHISKDGHSFIHYDPSQSRSFTVREAARVQTFPDNYLFCGSRTAQFHQVGNAVPPYLAKQIGEVVLGVFEKLNQQNP